MLGFMFEYCLDSTFPHGTDSTISLIFAASQFSLPGYESRLADSWSLRPCQLATNQVSSVSLDGAVQTWVCYEQCIVHLNVTHLRFVMF